MKMLAIETAVQPGSLALLATTDEASSASISVVAAASLDPDKPTARVFAGEIQRLLGQANWQIRDLNVVAVSHGPGSFTGLRIGITAAKTICYATGAKLIAVDTLRVLAFQAFESSPEIRDRSVAAAIDAHRGEWFVAQYQLGPSELIEQLSPCIMQPEMLLQQLPPNAILTGPIEKYRSAIAERLSDASRFICSAPQAAQLGQLAYRNCVAEKDDITGEVTAWNVTPKYLRVSAAEEKKATRNS